MSSFWNISGLCSEQKQLDKRYFEFLRVPTMSTGIYTLPVGGDDPQSPHQEDEMYYVVSGRARMKAGNNDQAVGPGSVIFVAARLEHRFYAVKEELTVLVFFAPAETSL